MPSRLRRTAGGNACHDLSSDRVLLSCDVCLQLRAVLEDIPVKAIKTGMLSDKLTIETIIKVLDDVPVSNRVPLVVDPVMVSTSGHRLLESSAISQLQSLLSRALIVTPNLREAEMLLPNVDDSPSVQLATFEEIRHAAQEISRSWDVPNVLIKGGHLRDRINVNTITSSAKRTETAIEYIGITDPQYPAILSAALPPSNRQEAQVTADILYTASTNSWMYFVTPWIDSQSTHGTGCTLSAAITCGLATGLPGMCRK